MCRNYEIMNMSVVDVRCSAHFKVESHVVQGYKSLIAASMSNPNLAQLAEHPTVDVKRISEGPWFDSGSSDFTLDIELE